MTSTELPVFGAPLPTYLHFWDFLYSAEIGLGLSPSFLSFPLWPV